MNSKTYTKKRELEKIYFKEVPNARRINPLYRSIFEFFYKAHLKAQPGTRVVNVYASHDFSADREAVYKNHFFKDADYEGVDFWEDKFMSESQKPADVLKQKRHTLPHSADSFDLLVTTKVVMEHVSEPENVLREFYRVLKPQGEAFIVVPFVRRQHQHPYDFFRYTEFGITYLLEKVGFETIDITHSNGFMGTAAGYAYFFERSLNIPRFLERIFDWIHAWIIEPIGYGFDRLDNGYGRDMTQYFLVHAQKKNRKTHTKG